MRGYVLAPPACFALVTLPVFILLTWSDDRAGHDAIVEGSQANSMASVEEKPDAPQKKPAFKDKSLQAWLEQLRNGKPKERAAAAKMLATNLQPKDTAAISPLIVALKDQDELVWSWAVKGLGRFGPLAKEALPALIEVAGAKYQSKYGTDVAETLGEIGPVAIPMLVRALQHKDPKIRQQVAQALGSMHRSARPALPALLQALNDKDKRVRATAAYALADVGLGREQVQPLLHALQDEDSTVRFAAMRALGTIGPAAKQAIPFMIKALDDKDEMTRYVAAEALAGIGPPPEALAGLTRSLHGKAGFACREAARALGKLGPRAKSAVPNLLKLLQDKKAASDVRCQAAEALGRIGAADARVLPALLEALKDKDAVSGAGSALGEMGPAAADAVPALVKRYHDGGLDVFAAQGIFAGLQGIGGPAVPHLADFFLSGRGLGQAMARDSLEALGPKAYAAVPKLIEAMKKPASGKGINEVNWKWQTAGILAAIGAKAKAAVPVLLETANDADFSTRHAAAYALYQIDPQAAKKAGIPAPPMSGQVFLNSARSSFDKGLSMGSGPPIGGKVLLWINGDPVRFFDGGGSMFSIDLWLRRGKNEISVSGKHDNPVYVAVATHYAMLNLDLAGKKAFAGPGSDDLAEPLVWDADKVPEIPERQELSTRPEDRKRYETEIRALLASLKDAIKAHNGDKAANLLFRGQRTWGPAHGERGTALDKQVASLATQLSSPNVQLQDDEPSVHLIFGKRLVMAYVERSDKIAGPVPYLITMKADAKRTGIDKLFFARIADEWIIWNRPDGLQVSLTLKVN